MTWVRGGGLRGQVVRPAQRGAPAGPPDLWPPIVWGAWGTCGPATEPLHDYPAWPFPYIYWPGFFGEVFVSIGGTAAQSGSFGVVADNISDYTTEALFSQEYVAPGTFDFGIPYLAEEQELCRVRAITPFPLSFGSIGDGTLGTLRRAFWHGASAGGGARFTAKAIEPLEQQNASYAGSMPTRRIAANGTQFVMSPRPLYMRHTGVADRPISPSAYRMRTVSGTIVQTFYAEWPLAYFQRGTTLTGITANLTLRRDVMKSSSANTFTSNASWSLALRPAGWDVFRRLNDNVSREQVTTIAWPAGGAGGVNPGPITRVPTITVAASNEARVLVLRRSSDGFGGETVTLNSLTWA